MIVLSITPTFIEIEGLDDLKIIDSISDELSYFEPSYKYSPSFKYGGWDGKKRLLTSGLKFPAGLLSRVESFLNRKKIEFIVKDKTIYPNRNTSILWQGHKLYDYQDEVIEKIMSTSRGMVKIATGGGKAQPASSKILTTSGWKRMGDIAVGDLVFDSLGEQATVLGVFPQGEKEVFELTFSDGAKAHSTETHLWQTSTAVERSHEKSSVKTLRSIIDTLKSNYKDNRKNHSIPICKPVKFEKKLLSLDPYLLGVLIGDGCIIKRIRLINADEEIFNEISSIVTQHDCELTRLTKTGRLNKITSAIRNSRLYEHRSWEKFIPQKYLLSNIDDRISLLQGLMDADGIIDDTGRVSYTTASLQLSKDFEFLIQSLGGTAKTTVKKKTYNYKGIKKYGRPAYKSYVALPTQIIPFRLLRKQNKIIDTIKYFPRRYIVEIKPIGFEECLCISVNSPTKLYLTDNCIVTHNTEILAKVVAEYNVRTMVYVVSLDLLSQMKETLERSLGCEVGIIGGGVCDIKGVTVCSVWTAGLACDQKDIDFKPDEDIEVDKWSPSELQREEIKEAVRGAILSILDEAQFAAANSIRMITKNSISAIYNYGFTATPWRSQGDDILLEAAFGKQICDISASKLIDMGYLVEPKIAFRDIPIYSKKLPKKWLAVKSSYISNNETRNEILINNTVSLLKMGRKPLLLFREINHGKKLLSMVPDDVRVRLVTGRISQVERDEIRNDFKAGKIDLILASTVYDQGIDLKELDALVLCGGGKSTAKALQRIGRVIRGNKSGEKKDAIIVETFDQAHYVKEHSITRYNIYNSEPKFILKIGSSMAKALGKSKGTVNDRKERNETWN